MTRDRGSELQVLPRWRDPVRAQMGEGNYGIRYSPAAVEAVEGALSSIGQVIVQFADAEGHLEAICTGLFASQPPDASPVLKDFRGHKRLLALIAKAYREAGKDDAATTFSAVSPLIHEGWAVRDRLAHAVWARSSQHPSAAILLKVRARTQEQDAFQREYAADPSGALERMSALPGEGELQPQLWLAEDFRRTAEMAKGVINTLLAFQLCAARPHEEYAEFHAAMRKPGLLAKPPYAY